MKMVFSQEPIQFSFWNKEINPAFSINETNLAYVLYENKFLLKEWNNKLIGLDIKTKDGRINMHFGQKGNINFSSNKTSVGYAQKMSPKLNLGLSVEYTFFHQREIKKNPALLTPTFGINFKQSELNSFYFSIYNSGIIFHNNGLPNSLIIFWNHQVNDNSSFSLGSITENQMIYASFAFHYFYMDSVKLTFEINSSEIPVNFAITCSLKSFEFLLENNYHQKLGISNQIGLAYKW
tara:strand:+ start:801 stop:1508 length:708 start_codon:yes stop_codon:yes gene_type:complete